VSIATSRRWTLGTHFLVIMGTVLGSQNAHPDEPPKPKELAISPAEQPAPALRYRLLPISSELNPGDAAPIYLRLRHELRDETWNQIQQKHEAWNLIPLEKIPVQEARKFVDQWSNTTKLLRIGSRRETCDWGVPLLEQRHEAIDILLPDCQSMRQLARLMQLKAKVETAERAYDQAVDTIETGITLGRHVSEGPFIINNIAGLGICTVMLDRVEELIAQPGAPNLYWALTALPRPLVCMRHALETEQRLGENMVPELAQVDDVRSPGEWESLLQRLYARLRFLAPRLTSSPEVNARLKSQLDVDLAAFKKMNLAASREYLVMNRHMDLRQVRQMSDDEVIARALAARYRDTRDDLFKLSYLPWHDAQALSAAVEQRQKSLTTGPLAVLTELYPAVMTCLNAQIRCDRRVAAITTIEAIRLYAFSHDGKLPESLGQVTEVPVPDDPATGKPLEYHLEDAAALLVADDAGLRFPPSFRLTVRPRTNAAQP
jgi:hypothetical protein